MSQFHKGPGKLKARIQLKYRLARKYGPSCEYCGVEFQNERALTLDHIRPLCHGGPYNDISNVALACLTCNKLKANLSLKNFMARLMAVQVPYYAHVSGD